jgi:hypothetical protein
MGDKLTKLYNTLALIETKGENTKTMAICLNYVQQLIAEANAEQSAAKEGD